MVAELFWLLWPTLVRYSRKHLASASCPFLWPSASQNQELLTAGQLRGSTESEEVKELQDKLSDLKAEVSIGPASPLRRHGAFCHTCVRPSLR